MHVPIELAEEAKRALEESLIQAGDAVMDDPDFRLRVDSDIEPYPGHYVDPDGAALWQIVSEFFRWDAVSNSNRELTHA
jgi:hypothetical protein